LRVFSGEKFVVIVLVIVQNLPIWEELANRVIEWVEITFKELLLSTL